MKPRGSARHPEYKVIADAVEGGAPRPTYQQDFGITPSQNGRRLRRAGIKPFTDPSATSRTPPLRGAVP